MKRPPPPFAQAGVNGVKPHQTSSSPPTTSKRLPGSGQSAVAGSTNFSVSNGVNGVANSTNITNKGPLNRSKKDAQKLGDQSMRLQRSSGRTTATDNEGRIGKNCPEPYGELLACLLLSEIARPLFTDNGVFLQSKQPPISSKSSPNLLPLSSFIYIRLISVLSNKMEAFLITLR